MQSTRRGSFSVHRVWEECVACELDLGAHRELVAEIAALADQSPFRERLTQLLMLAFYRGGRQVEALEAYRQLRRRLGDELGLDPSEETRQLHAAILRREPSLDPLRVQARPSAPAVSRADHVPAQLPASLADFVGRGDELLALH